jgi:isopenicillin-N epimerase
MREGFLLDPEVAYFNHGGYGACSLEVFEEYQRWQRELERDPTDFFTRRFEDELWEARVSWLCAPKGSGFLWARPEHQDWIEPLVVSWGYHEAAEFGERHGWQGTRDPSAYLAVPKAIEVHGSFELDAAGALADEAERRLASYGVRPLRGKRSPLMRALTVLSADPVGLQRRIYDEHRVEIPIYEWEDTTLMRLSIGPYTDEADLERLVGAVRACV